MTVLAFLAFALFAVLLAAGPTPALGAKGPAKVKLKIVKPDQRQIANKRFVRVRVRSARRGRVKVFVRSSTFDTKDKFSRFTRVAKPRFRRRGKSRVVKLRLTRAARQAARSCEARELQARSGRVFSRKRGMRRTTGACSPKPIDLSRADRCDFIASPADSTCMTPFPNNYFTLADSNTDSGRRIDFKASAMPVNVSGRAIDPAPWNASDGFSPGQGLIVRVPGLDNDAVLAATAPPGLDQPERFALPESPIVVLNTETRERHPIWVELSSVGAAAGGATLIVHPMVNFEPGTRYLVAMRDLRDAAGGMLAAPEGFRYYRDALPSESPQINKRRSHFERIFRRLANNGIPRANLYLAWDFTVASDRGNTGRALSIRDDAFSRLGDGNLGDRRVPAASVAPQFTVDQVVDDPAPGIARLLRGSFDVPCYLARPGGAGDCGPGGTFKLDGGGLPARTGTWKANYVCVVPESAVSGLQPEPGRPLLYGHDPSGTAEAGVSAEPQLDLAREHGFVVCATDQIGMSASDIPVTWQAFNDLSGLPKVVDRMQQGLLNQLYLGRLMVHPAGLVSDSRFRVDTNDIGSDPVLDLSHRAYYRSNGLGSVAGGALTALAPDFDRSALGGGSMNLSVLMPRSSDWPVFPVFRASYPPAEQPLALGLAQMLFDRAEANGYAHRMTSDPLPGTPRHDVLMDVAFGDHRATNWQSNVQARTISARAATPVVASGRWPGVDGQWRIPAISSYPYLASAIVYFDSGPERPDPNSPGATIGTGPPPIARIAPALGRDPHGDPGRTGAGRGLVSRFLDSGGRLSDPCGPGPCFSGGWTGP